MTRSISTSTLNAIEADTAHPILFVELRIDTGSPEVIDRLHTGLGTITWGGNDWTGAGSLASIEGVPESMGLSPNAVRMGLSGVDSTITDRVFDTEYYRRPVLVYLGALSDGALIEDPSTIFSGFIEKIEMVIGGEDGDSVVLTAESELILFKRSRQVRYTDSRLQSEFSGDKGFEFLEQVVNKKVVWRGQQEARLGGGAGAGTSISGASGRGGRMQQR